MVKNRKEFLSQMSFKKTALLMGAGFFFCQSAFADLDTQRTNLNNLKRCEQFDSQISMYCTNNHLMERAQQQTGLLRNGLEQAESGDSGAVADKANAGMAVADQARLSTQQVRQICQEAANRCGQICYNEANAAAQSSPPQTEKAQQYQQIGQKCSQELQASNARTGMALSEIASVIASLAQVMQALGIGQKDAKLAEINEPSDDPCDGQYADMLIECTGQSGPNSTRAGLNGNVVSGGGGSGDGLFQSGTQGEPGGDSKDLGKASAAGTGAGFMGGGMGMMGGMGGMDSGSGGSSGEEANDINSDIHRGFMGTGGGSGGGGGSGSSPARVAPFKGFSKADASGEGQDRAALERKLNKITSDTSSRAPASADGKNGPFQDNWSVINKAYKKNASSMFHQK